MQMIRQTVATNFNMALGFYFSFFHDFAGSFYNVEYRKSDSIKWSIEKVIKVIAVLEVSF